MKRESLECHGHCHHIHVRPSCVKAVTKAKAEEPRAFQDFFFQGDLVCTGFGMHSIEDSSTAKQLPCWGVTLCSVKLLKVQNIQTSLENHIQVCGTSSFKL